ALKFRRALSFSFRPLWRLEKFRSEGIPPVRRGVRLRAPGGASSQALFADPSSGLFLFRRGRRPSQSPVRLPLFDRALVPVRRPAAQNPTGDEAGERSQLRRRETVLPPGPARARSFANLRSRRGARPTRRGTARRGTRPLSGLNIFP